MGVTYVLSLNSKPVVTYIEEEAMSPLVFYYCICAFLCHCCSSTHLCVVFRHFCCCPVALFQGPDVTCRNFILLGLHNTILNVYCSAFKP